MSWLVPWFPVACLVVALVGLLVVALCAAARDGDAQVVVEEPCRSVLELGPAQAARERRRTGRAPYGLERLTPMSRADVLARERERGRCR